MHLSKDGSSQIWHYSSIILWAESPLVYTGCAIMNQPAYHILLFPPKSPSLGCLSLHKKSCPWVISDTCQDVLKFQPRLKGNSKSTYEPKFWSPSGWFESRFCHFSVPHFTCCGSSFIWTVETYKRSHIATVGIKWDHSQEALPERNKGSISISCYHNNYNTEWYLLVNISISCIRLWTEVLDGRYPGSFISTFLMSSIMAGQHRFCQTPAHIVIHSLIQQILIEHLICAPFYRNTPSVGILVWKSIYAGFHRELQCFATTYHPSVQEPPKTNTMKWKAMVQGRGKML